MGSSLIQIGQALSGAALPLAYGPCRVRGNNVLNQQLANNNRIALYILGEGPWDGIDRLWMNGKLLDLAATTQIHFHNGFDGTLGAGLAPTSFGGDQGVDQFWSLLPANFQPLTLSRKAYLMVQSVPDPQAPSNTLDVVADYRTMRVRIFDATGAQTAFQYSLNPAWQILDVIIREMLNREWTTAGAAAGGGDLTAAMKARISFTSFKAAADICDVVLANGAKTFEGGVAWPNLTGMQQALDTLCTLSQTYLVEQGGQITLLPDQTRPSTFNLVSDHITAGSFQATKSQLRGAQNRFMGTFNDINAQKNADIDTVGNVGLSRTSGVTTVTVPVGQVHGFLVGDNVDIVNPVDASFAGTITVATVPNTRSITGAQTGANATSGGGYVGTTESRFAQRTKVIDHEQHQLTVGQRGLNLSPVYKRVPVTIDFGNNTMERVERLLNFIKTRNLGVDTTPYAAPFSCTVQASAYSVDPSTNLLFFSEDFVNLEWAGGGNGATPTANFKAAPPPWQDRFATKLVLNATGAGQESYFQASTHRVPKVGETWTFSCWISADVPLLPALRFVQATGQNDVSGVVQVGPLWRRVYFQVTPVAVGTGQFLVRFQLGQNNGNITLYIFGAQVEVASAMGKYVHTIGTAVTDQSALIAQLPGDILTIDSSISEEFQGDYEIMKVSYARPTGEASTSQSSGADQSAQGEVLNLTLKQYLSLAFSTLSNTAQSLVASIARKGLPPAQSVDGSGNLVVSLGKTFDDVTTSRFAVLQVDGARRPIIDVSQAHVNKHLGNIPDDTAATARRAHLVGTLSNRPAAGTAGRLYHATDVGTNGTTYRDTGAAWVKVGVGHLGDADGNLDNVVNGTRCAWDSGTQKAAAVDVNGNVILKNVQQGIASTNSPNTTSTSPTVIAEMTKTLTTKGNKVLLVFSGAFQCSATNVAPAFAFFRDGSQIGIVYGLDQAVAANSTFPICLSFLDSPSAASHTYDVRYSVVTGTITARALDRVFQVVELG